MFTRRHLRRCLLAVIGLPMILLSLVIVDQQRARTLMTMPMDMSNILQYDRHASTQQDINYSMRSKRATNASEHVPSSMTVERTDGLDHRTSRSSHVRARHAPNYPVINTSRIQRFVHLDLKGASPRLDYYRTLFPFLKQLGATGLLIEYEDMFPFTGPLAVVRHTYAYSHDDIKEILQLAKINGLHVMPLLQVYGHLEYVLKLKEFVHLREDQRYPQVITPCLEDSYQLIFGR
jgi:hypothetical protein